MPNQRFDYEDMDFDQLAKLRDDNAGNMPMQIALAPNEHRAFARQATYDNPINALALAVAAPGYYLAKASGLYPTDASTTPADVNQMYGAYHGIGQGLSDYAGSVKNNLLNYFR